jgi:hypothetical protein
MQLNARRYTDITIADGNPGAAGGPSGANSDGTAEGARKGKARQDLPKAPPGRTERRTQTSRSPSSERFLLAALLAAPKAAVFRSPRVDRVGAIETTQPPSPIRPLATLSALPRCLVGCAQGSSACNWTCGARSPGAAASGAPVAAGIVPRLVHGAVFTTEGAGRHLAARPRVRCVRQPGRLAGTIIPW